MGRVNPFLEAPINSIKDRLQIVSGYSSILNSDEEQEKYETIYMNHILTGIQSMELFASVEEILLQLRTKNNLNDFKLGTQNDQVYAIAPFYKSKTENKHIKVYLGPTSLHGDNLVELSENKIFMMIAKERLINKMDEVVHNNIDEFEKKFGAVLQNHYL